MTAVPLVTAAQPMIGSTGDAATGAGGNGGGTGNADGGAGARGGSGGNGMDSDGGEEPDGSLVRVRGWVAGGGCRCDAGDTGTLPGLLSMLAFLGLLARRARPRRRR